MKRILFQGDSITDANRRRDDEAWKGEGYPTLITAKLGFEHPNEYEFINRGISGNRVVDLLARVKSDMINLKPDYMSILIGVNDVWHELEYSNGVSAERYEQIYTMLLDEVLESLPNLKIMILEPFVLRGSGTEKNYDTFRSEVEKRAAAVGGIAEKFHLPFIELQKKFDEATKIAPADYWLRDGVHPTHAGHELIAREWIRAFDALK